MLSLLISGARSACLFQRLISRAANNASYNIMFPSVQNYAAVCHRAVCRLLQDLLVQTTSPITMVEPVFVNIIVCLLDSA
jgi:hypothetical protein